MCHSFHPMASAPVDNQEVCHERDLFDICVHRRITKLRKRSSILAIGLWEHTLAWFDLISPKGRRSRRRRRKDSLENTETLLPTGSDKKWMEVVSVFPVRRNFSMPIVFPRVRLTFGTTHFFGIQFRCTSMWRRNSVAIYGTKDF